ncbi:MAG: LysR family transcriptional regulator, partial [Flavihumibacter sp.]
MTLVQLEYAIAVDTHRHFAGAAASCYVTQPTLSMQLHKLEEELGIRIFDRSRQPVVPTEVGALFLQHARSVIREMQLLEDVVREKQNRIDGE